MESHFSSTSRVRLTLRRSSRPAGTVLGLGRVGTREQPLLSEPQVVSVSHLQNSPVTHPTQTRSARYLKCWWSETGAAAGGNRSPVNNEPGQPPNPRVSCVCHRCRWEARIMYRETN